MLSIDSDTGSKSVVGWMNHGAFQTGQTLRTRFVKGNVGMTMRFNLTIVSHVKLHITAGTGPPFHVCVSEGFNALLLSFLPRIIFITQHI